VGLLVTGLAPRYEEHHGVHYTQPALKACVDLAARHLTDRFLPDNAIDVMDEVGAAVRLRKGREKKTVGIRDVETIVSRMARIPIAKASTSDRERLASLLGDLRRVVFGQDEAIETVVRAVIRSCAST
jgi:ATP-dependent Clp protease ATP-binding subunit ClpA